MTTITITGGRGFIGTPAAEYAESNGYKVRYFDRSDGNDILGDLSALRGSDHIIHLAGVLGTAELFDTPELAIDVNIKGTLRILDWCRDNGASFTGITLPPVFPSVYTATKLCADRLTTAWNLTYGVPTSVVRAFNVFGIGQKWGPGHPQKFLPTFATKAWRGEPIEIWGDGTQTMDVIHTSDLGRMLVEATQFGDDSVFDAGCGESISVNNFANFVLEVTKSKSPVVYLPMRKGEVATRIKATGEGWDKLGWQPKLSWHKVTRAIEWYKDK